MIKDGTYSEFADQQIGYMDNGERLHGGNFAYLLNYDAFNAARVYKVASDKFGPFVTAAEFAMQCDWNEPGHAEEFAQTHQEWPPRQIAEELSYL